MGLRTPDVWNYVAVADSLAEILALPCLGGDALQLLKAEHPGAYVQDVTKESCETPEVQVSGKIYAIS
jgi:hypothetical protein